MRVHGARAKRDRRWPAGKTHPRTLRHPRRRNCLSAHPCPAHTHGTHTHTHIHTYTHTHTRGTAAHPHAIKQTQGGHREQRSTETTLMISPPSKPPTMAAAGFSSTLACAASLHLAARAASRGHRNIQRALEGSRQPQRTVLQSPGSNSQGAAGAGWQLPRRPFEGPAAHQE
jgi:hypothetical protein